MNPEEARILNCPVCNYSITDVQNECPNCGTILAVNQKQQVPPTDRVVPNESIKPVPISVVETKQPKIVDESLPIWMVVRDLLASGHQLEINKQKGQALDQYYQALEMSASHRRENPAMGASIIELLTRIEKLEGGQTPPQEVILPKGPEIAVDSEKTIIETIIPEPLISREIPPQVFTESKIEKPINKKKITPENIELLTSANIWERNEGEVFSIAVSPDQNTLGIAMGKRAYLIDMQSEEIRKILSGHLNQVYCVTFSPDGQRVATGSTDWDIKLWQVSSGLLLHTLEGHKDDVFCVAFSPDGQSLVSGSADKRICIWNTFSGKLTYSFEQHKDCIESVAFSPDGSILASASDDGMICLWRYKDISRITTWHAHHSAISALAFSPKDHVLASSADDGVIGFWKLSSGTLVATVKNNTNSVECLAYSPDGQILVSGGGDGVASLWRTSNYTQIMTLEHADSIMGITFTPDGEKLIVSLQDGEICFWEIGN